MWWIGLLIVIIFIIVVTLILWSSRTGNNLNNVSRDGSNNSNSGTIETVATVNSRGTPNSGFSILEDFLGGPRSNPLVGLNNPTGRISISRPDNPWIGNPCISDIFDGNGGVCSNGRISATYYSHCNESTPCQDGSICLNGVCTPLSITELNGHPFQIKEDRAILYPAWQTILNVVDVCNTPQIGNYLFICSINGKMVVFQGSDLVNGNVKLVNFPQVITTVKRMAYINHLMAPTMVPWLSDSNPKLMNMLENDDLIWYLVLDLDKQLYLVGYSINQDGMYNIAVCEAVNCPISIDLTDFNSSNQAYLMISDTCSYLVTIRNGEVVAESFEGCLSGAVSGRDHLCLITDQQVNYYWRTDTGWEKFILNSRYKQVQFQKPWFILLLDYDAGVYKYQLVPRIPDDDKYEGVSWIRHNIRALTTTSLCNGGDHVYAISTRVDMTKFIS